MTTQILNGKMSHFINQLTNLVEQTDEESTLLQRGSELLHDLVAEDDWLPESCSLPHPDYYQQYLLYRDPAERFSVVSFVWGPGQKTPIHDHTVWGLIGMLRGGEAERSFEWRDGKLIGGESHNLKPGDVGKVSPKIGDIHQVWNRFSDQVSISIHVYGADIGKVKRHVFTEAGESKKFISGYTNTELPVFI